MLLNLFIFINRAHSPALSKILKEWCHRPTQTIKLDLERKITVNSELTSKTLGGELAINQIDDLIIHMLNWES